MVRLMMSLRSVRPFVPVVVLLGAALLTGCSSIADRVGEAVAEKAIEGATGSDIKVDEKGEEVTITTDDGSMTMGTSLPEGWPSSLPLPANHVVVSAIALDTADGPSSTAVLQVPDGVFEDVVAELEGAFASSSWAPLDEAMTTDMGEIQMWARQFSNDGQKVHVQVQRMDEVNVLYGLEALTED